MPNVDSVMVRLVRRPDAPDATGFARLATVIEAAFSQRRKTLRNTLRSLGTPEVVTAAAAAAGVDLSDRAEELGPQQFIRLADALSPPPVPPTPGSSTPQR